MPAFADLEAQANAAIQAALANAVAILPGGETLPGIFEEPSAEAFGLVTGGRPVFDVPESQAPVRQSDMTISGVAYRVSDVLPDGTGRARLVLEVA